MSTPQDLESYVREALKLQGYTFAEPEIERIVGQLMRFAAVAKELDAIPIPETLSAAPVFRP